MLLVCHCQLPHCGGTDKMWPKHDNNYIYVLNFQAGVTSYYLEEKLWRFACLCRDTLIDLLICHHVISNLTLGPDLDKIIGWNKIRAEKKRASLFVVLSLFCMWLWHQSPLSFPCWVFGSGPDRYGIYLDVNGAISVIWADNIDNLISVRL